MGRGARTVPCMFAILMIAATLAAVLPVPGAVVRAFEAPEHEFAAGHRGVDLGASPDEEVRAALPGLVGFAGLVAGRGWITVRHAGPGLETTYGDLDPRLVVVGEHVEAGQVIGRLAATADHLDWGARLDGRYIDPLSLLGPWEIYLVSSAPAQVARSP